MRLLHTMVRVDSLEASKRFYVDGLGMRVLREKEYPDGRFTLCFVGYGDEHEGAVIELTHNWDPREYVRGDRWGHIAIGAPNLQAICDRVGEFGGRVTRAPGPMKFGGSVIAFVEDPNGVSVELIETT